MSDKKNLVAVPVYNEAALVIKVLDSIRRNHPCSIVVIDDGSTDGTSDLLDRYEGITLLRHKKNEGYGQSLLDAFRFAMDNRFEKLVTIDCDEQHEPQCIPIMFNELTDCDILSGSRYLTVQKGDDAPPEERRKVNVAITQEINQLTGWRLTDTFCGFKSYRVQSLTKLSLTEPGYAMPLQFWVQAWHFGLTVRERAVPRIYKNLDRSFGGNLDDSDRRLAYYRKVIDEELKRWSISSLSEPTLTT